MKNWWVGAGWVNSLVLGSMLVAGCGSGGDSPVAAQNSGVIDLSGVMQNWDKNLPSTSRFTVLTAFNNQAVRDNNTGLVWERSPQTGTASWSVARLQCTDKNVGGTKGWRLPSIFELASMIDPSVAAPGPTLPPGHPFLSVQSDIYWSATADAEVPTYAFSVPFTVGAVNGNNKSASFQVWCVRGGMNADQY